MIKIHETSKSFDKKQVLNNITLEVNRGEVVCLLGPVRSRQNHSDTSDHWSNKSRQRCDYN